MTNVRKDPSPDAINLAQRHWPHNSLEGGPYELAVALQKLMDERDEALRTREAARDGHGGLEEAYREVCNDVDRLEEEKLALVHQRDQALARAEQERGFAEQKAYHCERAEKRAEKAEREVAELCCNMREWIEGLDAESRLSSVGKQWFYGFLNNPEAEYAEQIDAFKAEQANKK